MRCGFYHQWKTIKNERGLRKLRQQNNPLSNPFTTLRTPNCLIFKKIKSQNNGSEA